MDSKPSAEAGLLVDDGDEFGWIRPSSSGTDLVQVGNAVAYGARGIMVGTTIPIPEPSTALLLASGLAALAVWRRRKPL